MKILFIGGTGRLSSEVAKRAAEDDKNEVYLFTRGSSNRKKFIYKNYKMIYGNIRKKEESKEKIKKYNFDVVIDFLSYNINDLQKTLEIIDGHYKQYIFISSATVYCKSSENEIIKEDKTKIGNKKWEYAWEKYNCEKYLEEYFSKRKEKYTIIRPYVTYNETRFPYLIVPFDTLKEYSLIKRIKDEKKIPIIENDNIITTLTNAKDFAKGAVGLFMNEKACGEDFNITGDERVRWGDTLRVASEYYHKKLKTENFMIKDFVKKYNEYDEVLYGDKGKNMLFDNSKIKEVVPEFKSEISLKKGIDETLKFYDNNKEFDIIDYMWYGKIDRICHDRREKKFKNKRDKMMYNIGYNRILEILYKIYKKIRRK